MIEFCRENSLCVMNTQFEQHKRRLYTWTAPNGIHRNQIDYIMCQKRWKSSVLAAKTLPGADCGTDHELLMAKIRIKLRKVKRTTVPQRFDIENIQDRYVTEVRNRFSALELEGKEPEAMWNEIRDTVISMANEHVPKVRKTKRKEWMSEEAIKIAEERRVKKTQGDLEGTRKLNADFQRQVRRDKAAYLNEQCKEVEENNKKGRSRDLFKKISEITGKSTDKLGVTKNREGKDLIEEEELKNRWKEYTEDLYKKDDDVVEEDEEDEEYEQEPEILESEVRQALSELSNRKSPGIDRIPIELFKVAGDEAIQVLTKLCQQIWKTGVWPTEWKKSVYVPIPKKGDAKVCSNNRTIALIPHASKVLLKVIQKRMEPYMEREMPEEQAGFRKGRGTRDQIANLRWILEKARDYRKDIFMCFIDYSKAFDCVNHARLWTGLRKMGIPRHLIELMKGVYTDQQATVRTVYGDTEWFKIGKGVRQGCILSPYLFNLYSEYIMRQANLEEEGGVKISGQNRNNLRYADDTTLLAEGEDSLKRMIDRIREESLKAGLRLNVSKTKIMSTGKETNIEVDGEKIEEVESFMFLGSRIDKDASCEGDIRLKIAKARTAMLDLTKIWKDRDISRQTKIRIAKAMVFPIAMYGCESWTMRQSDRERIDAFEMWIWRRLLRIAWVEKKTNKYVLEQIKPEKSLEALVVKQRLSYFGHVMRHASMENNILFGRVAGPRRRGGPKRKWMDGITEATGKTVQQLRDGTEDRQAWRAYVHRVTKSRKRLNGL